MLITYLMNLGNLNMRFSMISFLRCHRLNVTKKYTQLNNNCKTLHYPFYLYIFYQDQKHNKNWLELNHVQNNILVYHFTYFHFKNNQKFSVQCLISIPLPWIFLSICTYFIATILLFLKSKFWHRLKLLNDHSLYSSHHNSKGEY